MTDSIRELSHQFSIFLKSNGFLLVSSHVTSMEVVRPIQGKAEKSALIA